MPSQLTEAHIRAQARLRHAVANAVGQSWRNLPGYDERDVPRFLAQAVPLVTAGQRRSQALAEAYVAAFMGRAPLGVPLSPLRGGADPREVYTRPFVTVWSALKAGSLYEDAVNAGLARATSTAAMDVQLAHRATLQAVQEADDGIYGYERVADGGACAFCQEVDGAFLKSADAMPLHNNCGCGIEPLTAPRSATRTPSTVAVHEHGELGPMLAAPEHAFTGPGQI